MKFKQIVGCLLTAAVLLGAQINIWAQNDSTANLDVVQGDVILQWNRVLMETVSTPGQHPATIMPVRSYAIMHAAMFDAVNSIDGSYDAVSDGCTGIEKRFRRSRRRTSRARCFSIVVSDPSGGIRCGTRGFVRRNQIESLTAGNQSR